MSQSRSNDGYIHHRSICCKQAMLYIPAYTGLMDDHRCRKRRRIIFYLRQSHWSDRSDSWLSLIWDPAERLFSLPSLERKFTRWLPRSHMHPFTVYLAGWIALTSQYIWPWLAILDQRGNHPTAARTPIVQRNSIDFLVEFTSQQTSRAAQLILYCLDPRHSTK